MLLPRFPEEMSRHTPRNLCEFSRAALSKYPEFSGAWTMEFSHSSGGWKFKIKVLAELIPAKALTHASLLVSSSLGDSLACKWLSSPLSPYCLPSAGICGHISLFVSFPRSTQMTSSCLCLQRSCLQIWSPSHVLAVSFAGKHSSAHSIIDLKNLSGF